jgi:hypothetical protein
MERRQARYTASRCSPALAPTPASATPAPGQVTPDYPDARQPRMNALRYGYSRRLGAFIAVLASQFTHRVSGRSRAEGVVAPVLP